MYDVIKKALLTGIGLAGLTKAKLEELSDTLAKQGELSEKEGKKLLDELCAKAEQAKNDLEAQVERIAKQTIKKMNLVARDELLDLAQKVRKMEQDGTHKD